MNASGDAKHKSQHTDDSHKLRTLEAYNTFLIKILFVLFGCHMHLEEDSGFCFVPSSYPLICESTALKGFHIFHPQSPPMLNACVMLYEWMNRVRSMDLHCKSIVQFIQTLEFCGKMLHLNITRIASEREKLCIDTK